MLKGWTMTDLVCHHCRTTPLMREPTSEATAAGRSDAQRIQFCGRCDGSPHGSCTLFLYSSSTLTDVQLPLVKLPSLPSNPFLLYRSQHLSPPVHQQLIEQRTTSQHSCCKATPCSAPTALHQLAKVSPSSVIQSLKMASAILESAA